MTHSIQELHGELAAYRSTYPQEADTVDRVSAFMEAHENCFSRNCTPGHVTGSAFIVDPDLKRVVLVHHGKLNLWLQPGGHCEEGETVREAAFREAAEETGLRLKAFPDIGIFDIDIHTFPARGSIPAHFHYDFRYLLVAETFDVMASEESHAVAWFDFASAGKRTPERSILRPLGKIEALGRVISATP